MEVEIMVKLPRQTVNEVYAERDKLKAINADLLAALERAHQYVWLQLRDARDDKRLSPGTIKTAERDLEMVEAAIAKAHAKED